MCIFNISCFSRKNVVSLLLAKRGIHAEDSAFLVFSSRYEGKKPFKTGQKPSIAI